MCSSPINSPFQSIPESRSGLVIELPSQQTFDDQQLWQHITEAQCQCQTPTDSWQTPALEFKIGSQAYIKAQFFCTTQPSRKLSKKFLGPYEIFAWSGTHLITLLLLDSLCTVHLVFLVSMLEPATLNLILNHVQPPPLPITVNDEPEFENLWDSQLQDRQPLSHLQTLIPWLCHDPFPELSPTQWSCNVSDQVYCNTLS